MQEFTDEDRRMIVETHDTVITLNAVLLGANGDGGLVGDHKELKSCHQKTENKLNKVIVVLAGLGGLVLLGSGIYGFIQIF